MALTEPNENVFCAECGSRPKFRGEKCVCVPIFESPSFKAFALLTGIQW